MSERKKPFFGGLSLILMLGLIAAGLLVVAYDEPISAMTSDESFAVAMEAVANIVATLLVIGTVSITSMILAGISLLRREHPTPAAIALCLAVPALGVTILTITLV